MSNNKKNKISNSFVIGIAAATVTTGLFTFLSYQTFKTEPIIVAAKDIDAFSNTPIVAEDFKTLYISSRNKKDFEGFVDNVNSLIGTIPTTNITTNQPVKRSQFINPENAEEVQSIVSSDTNRGIYLPVASSNVLLGDLKVGSSLDLYILTTKPQPTAADPDNEITVLLPFQMSFRVEAMKMQDETTFAIFFDFPMEESERYLMLKEMLENGSAELVATMPNSLHKEYDGSTITEEEFKELLITSPDYFTNISKANETTSNIEVTVDTNNNAKN